METKSFLRLIIILFVLAGGTVEGIDTKDTRMMSQPAVNGNKIAFIYAEDLWTANLDGTEPVRLTVDEGVESDPAFSPDGRFIAFSAQYDGNTDVFILPTEGGIPQRLTWHPGDDIVRGFSPDGKNVLFISQRFVFTTRYYQFFLVPVTGGFPVKAEIPNGWTGSYSPDGQMMAYTPLAPAYTQWKNYRGGRISTIWIIRFSDKSIREIPQPEGGCNDASPMWIGGKIFFLSDRNGEFNLYSYQIDGGSLIQHTKHNDFPVINASTDGRTIILEQAGKLHSFNPATLAESPIKTGIATDLLELRPRFVEGTRYIRTASISPTGSRLVMNYRGDIFTLPAEKGDPRNITGTQGAHEKYPSWSPDGKNIAFFSDESGEYLLHIMPQDGKGETKKIKLTGTGFYAWPEWSPDNRYISYTDNGRSLYLLDNETGTIKKIDSDEIIIPGAFRRIFGDWSTDSKWLLYTKVLKTNFKKVMLYSVDQGKSFPVTDGLSDAGNPVFDPGGEYIYLLASTDAGPVLNWFDLSSADMRMTNSIYLVTTRMDIVSPLIKESDEEKIAQDVKPAPPAQSSDKGKKNVTAAAAETKNTAFKIDTDGLQNRIISLPVRPGNISNLGVAATGEILYILNPSDRSGSPALRKFTLKDRKDEEVMELTGYMVSADRKKMMYTRGETIGITAAGKKPEPGKGVINTSSISLKIDPVAEWEQIFNEAWRINRDYFYDPGMHGADWEAIRAKYATFLPHLTTRSDLNRLIQWMCSELGVGHHRVGGGDRLATPPTVGTGLLGADYEVVNNRYRFKKIYGGLNWNPSLVSPLTVPGLNIEEGDYLLAVNGKEVTADRNIFSFFENSAGKLTELTIGATPDIKAARVVQVVPVSGEATLRNRDWVEGNLKRVTEATGGKVAYVYVPNTSTQGHEYFKRYFFPQADRQAIIIDERFNGGGLVADYYIDLLQRPFQSYWNMRYGLDLKTPTASIQGPKVMIIDEMAGSGGDMLPWMFRKFGVGTLVGKRTWGGLVGTLGFPELMDGGSVTAPNLAIWTNDGYIVENVGIEPDIEVEQLPAEVLNGRDPQLEKAIEVALKELEKNPPQEPVRPPYPVRVRKQQP